MQQLVTTRNELIPSNRESLARQLLGILQEAKKKNGVSEQDERRFVEYAPDLQAQMAQDMLEIAAKRQDELKVSQALIVAYVVRHELWRLKHLSLRDFLRDAGLGHSRVSVLNGFGDLVVPYCDSHSIELSQAMGAEHWGKLRDAMPALKQAVKDDESEEVQEILDDVVRATNREAIRGKYQKRRHEPLGHAATYTLPDGSVVLIALLDDCDASAELVSRLDGRLKWDLIFTCGSDGLVFECPSQ